MNYEHLSKIRAQIALHTNKKTENILDGGFTSIFRGRSLDFDDLREYQPGDNVRDIDWKSSSKLGKTLVRRYVAERKHNVLFVCDSGEKMIGDTSTGESKAMIAESVLGTLMFLINRQGDDFALLQKKKDGVDFSFFKSGAVHFESLISSYERNLGVYMLDYDRQKLAEMKEESEKKKKKDLFRSVRYGGVDPDEEDLDDEDDYEEETAAKDAMTPQELQSRKYKKKQGLFSGILDLFSTENLREEEIFESTNRNLVSLLTYCAENIRRKKIVFIITDMDGISMISDSLLKKLNVTSDVLLIQIEDAFLEGDNVYDLEMDRYEDDFLLHNKKLREAAKNERAKLEDEMADMLNRGRVSRVKISSEKEIVDRIIELFERHKNETFG